MNFLVAVADYDVRRSKDKLQEEIKQDNEEMDKGCGQLEDPARLKPLKEIFTKMVFDQFRYHHHFGRFFKP